MSYNIETHTTTGFFRGTKNSLVGVCIKHLKKALRHAAHPLLIPRIILSHEMNAISNTGLSCSKGSLRPIEETIMLSSSTLSLHQLPELEKKLVVIHNKTLQRQPQALIKVVKNFERTVSDLNKTVPVWKILNENSSPSSLGEFLQREEEVTRGALNFNSMRLEALKAEVAVALQTLEMLRSVVQNQFQVSLADSQSSRDKAKQAKADRYSHNSQAFGLLGVIFLPPTFYAVCVPTRDAH